MLRGPQELLGLERRVLSIPVAAAIVCLLSSHVLLSSQDDVDILTFLIIHSYTPIQMALSISHKLEERNEERVDNVGSVSKRKVDLFSRMAVDLTQLIPLGRDFSRERFNALSHRGGDPTQVRKHRLLP